MALAREDGLRDLQFPLGLLALRLGWLVLGGGCPWPWRFPNCVDTCSLSVAALGFKVNLAARMMVSYPGLVSCDAETYAASRLPSDCFKELPRRKMKGVTNSTPVYQYVGITEKQ